MSTFARCVVAIAVLFTSVACTESDPAAGRDEPESPARTTTASTTTTAAGPVLNERGHIVKGLGEESGFGDGPARVTFAIDAIQVDPPCGEVGTKPEAGHTLLLSVRVQTGNDQDTVYRASSIINRYAFSVLGPDGVITKVEPGLCTPPGGRLPDDFEVNQKHEGPIELVVPAPSGQLILQALAISGTGGWEWAY